MLLALWQKLSRFPLGKCIFNASLRWKVPYTGSICPEVLEMREGFVRVQMKDRRRVRNHLHSIHAIAMMNLGEASSGMAVLTALPENARAIITHLEIDYFKKARGTLVATADFKERFTQITENKDFEVEASIKDSVNDEVAKVKARWRVGPNKRT